jgi:hypothetical protein
MTIHTPINADFTLEDGLTSCGRCVWGYSVGFITKIERETFCIGWIDGTTTTHLRPDAEEDEADALGEAA